MSNPTTIRLDDGLDAAIRGMVEASAQTDKVPILQQSQIMRVLLKDSVGRLLDGEISIETVEEEVDGEVLKDLLPDHVLAKHLREDLKDESWLADMKGGFEGRVREALSERFKNGYDPEEAAEFAETYIREAHIYWEVIEDAPEKLNEKVSYVRERIEDYREKHEVSTYDPDEEFLASFTAVEEGEEIEQAANRLDRALIEDANRMIVEGISTGGDRTEGLPEPLTATEARDRLAARTGVSKAEAVEAVERAGGVFHEDEETETAVADGGEEDPDLVTDGGVEIPEDVSPVDLGRSLSTPPGVEEPATDEAAEDDREDSALRFRATGEGYEYVTDVRPEEGERPVYIHRLTAVAWDVIDGLDDPRHVHHEVSVPWFNTEENLSAELPDDHARYHILDEDDEIDRGDGLITDGGRDQAMREDYWEKLSTDGGDPGSVEQDAEPRTVLDLVREACDPEDELHSVVPTSRDGDVIYAWTVREQPAKSGSGSVLHLRLIKVDKDAKAATWTSYGTILSMTDNLQSGLVKALARARDGGEDPGVFNGLNAGSDEMAREMFAEDVETGSPTGEVEDFSDRSVEADDVSYVTCEDCGEDLPKEEAENFGGGLIDAWVHSGPCPDEGGEADE